MQMPDIPNHDSGWESWIIGTLIAMVSTMVTTIIAVVRFIQGQYVTQIAELQSKVAHNTNALGELQSEAIKCIEDRARLQVKVEAIESDKAHLTKRIEALEKDSGRH
jgi:hypothetical protein